MDEKLTYKDAGVDVEAGYEAVKLMKQHTKKTMIPGVLGGLGSFGAMFELPKNEYENPVMVSGTDGVGTKLQIAFMMDKHDTIGIDCVAMCANDVACQGAKPLFFLDYIGTGKLQPNKAADIVKGICDGCVMAGCALIGGETAEMPGFYKDEEYDLAGFSVGIVEKAKIINGSRIQEGDAIIGIASSGIHSNGYSLVRKLFFERNNYSLSHKFEELDSTLGEELLKPTKIYVKNIMKLIESFDVKGIAHITGGGFIENIPRVIPEGLKAVINTASFKVLPIFEVMQKLGNIEYREMFNTFNMGIGLVVVAPKVDAHNLLEHLSENGETAYLIGEIAKGHGGIELWQR